MTVAIVGAGLSGSLLAALLAARGRDCALIERSGVFGPGLAYSTTNDSHRLNVRSGRMSAMADDPAHFVRWLERTGQWDADPDAFAPRRVYGVYIQDLLAQAERDGPGRVERIAGEVVLVTAEGVRLADGRALAAHRIVLATGNPAPRNAGASEGVIPDAWAPGALDRIGPHDDVAVLGSGLTMIDVVLDLEDRGWTGRATALSRRGLLPRAHDATQAHAAPRRPLGASLSRRMKAFRARAADIGWGVAMDELRAINADLWSALSDAERGRFLRHLRPWWDVHRHRVATDVARRIDSLVKAGRLQVRAGRLERVEPSGGAAVVHWRPRGARSSEVIAARALIDCSGPGVDPTRADDALTAALLSSGEARPDPHRLGFDLDRDGRILSRAGAANDRVFVLGPPSRAAFWEVVAVPDIRVRARALADRLV